MKRTPLKRKTRLKPRSTTKKKRPAAAVDFDAMNDKINDAMATLRRAAYAERAQIDAESLENSRRREWVHRQPCVFGRVTGDPCSGPLDEMHCDRGKGVGIKSPLPTFPGCRRHHELVSGAVRHTLVIPMNTLWRRAFEALASEQTERDWVEVQAHDQRRKGLL